jgi:hypothetical protein
MVKRRSKMYGKEHKKWKMLMGIGIFIFGLTLWFTNWAVAFMVLGILAFLCGLLK